MILMRERLTNAAQQVSAWRQEYLATHYGATRRNLAVSTQALCELARVYFLAGRQDESRTKLQEALGREPRSAQVLNNLAVVEAAAGNLTLALEHCAAALELEAGDPGIWLNLGMLRYAAGDTLGAGEPLSKGMEMSGGWAQACRLLGLPAEEAAERGGTSSLTAQEARELLAAALRRLPKPPSEEVIAQHQAQVPSETEKSPAPAAEKDPTGGASSQGGKAPVTAQPSPAKVQAHTRVGGTRSGEAPIEKYLYWKEAGGGH
jgi:tetratricopeptide (TPR) repeat protein